MGVIIIGRMGQMNIKIRTPQLRYKLPRLIKMIDSIFTMSNYNNNRTLHLCKHIFY